MRRWLALLPLIMLALAALACSPPPPDPIYHVARVLKVSANPQIAGTVYVWVEGQYITFTYSNLDNVVVPHKVYETTDYGQNWHETDKLFPDSVSGISCFMRGEDLYIGDKLVWSFPRPVFRSIFFSHDADNKAFQLPVTNLPLDAAFSPADPSVLYIPMGTEGVLVGPNPNIAGAEARPWRLTHNGFIQLRPHALTINPSDDGLLFTVGAFVALPFLVYAWLLTQVWRYAFPADGQHRALALASALSIGLGVIAWLAIWVWLSDDRIEVPLFVAAASISAMMITTSSLIAIWLAHSRHFTTAFTVRFALATAVLSLMVPVGIVGGLTAWVIIIFGIIGFMFYRRGVSHYMETRHVTTTQWGLDRLSVELTILVFMLISPIGLMFTALSDTQFNSSLKFLGALVVVLSSLAGLTLYIKWRGQHMMLKKKAVPDLGLEDELPLFQGNVWWNTLSAISMGWIITAGSISIVLWIAQALILFKGF